MNPKLLIGVGLFAAGFLMLVASTDLRIVGLVVVIVGGILARTGARDLVASKTAASRKQEPKA